MSQNHGFSTSSTPSAEPLPRDFITFAEQVADRWRYVTFLLLVLFYLIGYNTGWRMQPDSAFYLEIGRNIQQGQGFTYHGEINRLAYPGLPRLLAVFHAWFPDSVIPAANVLMLVLSLVALAATYRLITRAVSRPKAIIVTFFFVLSVPFIKQSYTILTDIPFYLGVCACLLGFECFGVLVGGKDLLAKRSRGDRIGGLLLIAGGLMLAALMRPMVLPFVLAILATAVFEALRHRALRALWVAAGLLLVLGVVYIAFDPRRSGSGLDQYEKQLLASFYNLGGWARHIVAPNILEFTHDVLPATFFGYSLSVYGDILLTAGLLVLAVHIARTRVLWMLWVFAVFATMMGVVAQDRYLLPVLPMLILVWWQLAQWLAQRFPGRKGNLLALTCYLLLWPAAGRGIATVWLEQVHPSFLQYYRDGKYQPVVAAAELVRLHVGPQDIVIANEHSGRIISYLTQRRVLESWKQLPPRTPVPNTYVLLLDDQPLRRRGLRFDSSRTYTVQSGTTRKPVQVRLCGLTAVAATKPKARE